ncbi:MAG: DUF1178 family protein [Syntrophales bacterium]|nr:DUF1178 family protein [Syntrophales bacterium]
MIIYDLKCESDHRFEGWFQDSASFEKQKGSKGIGCPVCGSLDVEMVPSSLTIGGRRTGPSDDNVEDQALSPAMTLRMLHDFIDRHFDNVGTRFAEAAIKMHRGEEPKRNIKGHTTESEEEILRDEGIEFIRIPVPPKLDS